MNRIRETREGKGLSQKQVYVRSWREVSICEQLGIRKDYANAGKLHRNGSAV